MRGVRKEMTMISLDDYVDFFLSHKQLHLSANSLNQIISLHGFKKIHKSQKKVLIDALETLDLMDPSRSTLTEPISSGVPMALDDILNDLNRLNWQDCGVVSVQTLNSSKNKNYGDHHPSSADPKLKPKIKRKKKKTMGVINGDGLNEGTEKLVRKMKHSGLVAPGGDGSCCSSAVVSLSSY